MPLTAGLNDCSIKEIENVSEQIAAESFKMKGFLKLRGVVIGADKRHKSWIKTNIQFCVKDSADQHEEERRR